MWFFTAKSAASSPSLHYISLLLFSVILILEQNRKKHLRGVNKGLRVKVKAEARQEALMSFYIGTS